ncbi:OLC1v1012538C2 [Oldenlandia corymbosa var. corymbosa]|uniref:OLC1v1012538C2 n=1 Tax=Oldenlandia corymbosa var. corymbosa TaxID=529605 RepID=A0AAV1DW43_OLDCO|nr:OLC1v1012538C2 [Oldenlandia corymbosa var. corymbosa]
MRRWKPLWSSTNAILQNSSYRRSSFPVASSISRQLHGTASSAFPHSRPKMWHRTSILNAADLVSTKWMLTAKNFIHSAASDAKQRDYYEILGVSETATREEIKKAFHALAKKYHPDANRNNPSSKRKFQEIREAYETLQDPKKRSQYDRMKEDNGTAEGVKFSMGDAGGFRYSYSDINRNEFSDSFHKVFSEIFENAADFMATDIEVELSLTFSEAAQGCTKHLSFDADVTCDSCDGRGHPLNARSKVCPSCRGAGKVSLGPFFETCNTCSGSGRVVKEFCRECQGSGIVEGVKEVKVTVPAGLDTGDTIRVPKSGNASKRGFQPGNLFINIKVSEDPIFVRDGADIYVDSNISFTQAILGGEVEVPTLSGKVQLQIPKGVQHGQLLTLRGKGLPKRGYFVDHGNQYVRFRVNFPVVLNERQRAILDEFAKEEVSNEENRLQHIFDRFLSTRSVLEFSILMLILLFVMKIL